MKPPPDNASPGGETPYSILDNLLEGCQIIGPDWRYLYVNDALVKQGKLPREGLLGRTMMECYPGIDQAPFFAVLRKCMEERVADQLENEFTFPDGSKGWFELRFEPVPEGVFILSLDTSERRRIQEQLVQSQKMEAIGRLAGGVAHDFNNLLTVILLYGERLLEKLPADDPNRGAVEQIKLAGERASALTAQLLAFSRQQVFEPKRVDLNQIVTGSEKMLCRMIGEDISLSVKTGSSTGAIMADSGRVEQVLLNLAVNARDAMPRGGMLSIETRDAALDETYARTHLGVRPGSYVMLAVSDNGKGMDRATQARIFEPFFTTKPQGEGTGLGLSTVFGIVRQCGGSVWVYSEPGKGSTFKVYFPRAEAGAPEQPETQAAHVAGGRETIMLVEDDEPVRTITAAALRDLGYTVLEAGNGREAIAVSRAHTDPVHLVASDVVMPGMGGPKVARAIRAQRPDVKVLFLSGYTDDAMIRHGIIRHEVAFLQKPFTKDSLAKKVRETLDG